MAGAPVLQEGLGGSDRGAAGGEPPLGGDPTEHPSDVERPVTLTCSKCRAEKPVEEFSPSPKHRGGRYPWCKPCKAAYAANWIRKIPKEELSAYNAKWRAQRDADKEAREQYLRQSVAYSLKSRYGITQRQAVELAAFQGGVCAICHSPPRNPSTKRGGLHVDHDHTTGLVRGLLCEPCNQGLGFFRDDVARLQGAIEYLGNPPAARVVFTEPMAKPARDPAKRNPEKTVSAEIQLICKQCGDEFSRKAQSEHRNRARGKEGPFCGQRCAGLWFRDQRGVKGLVHGTTTGYTSFKCRCPDCKRAHAEAERDRLRRRSDPTARGSHST